MAVKTCEFCGSTYLESVKECPNCGKKEIEKEKVFLDGIDYNEWMRFIGKDSERYIKVFTKNQGKKYFISWNGAAFIFGFNWMFYRRMYKFAIYYLIITMVFTIVFSFVTILAYQGAFKDFQTKQAAYYEVVESFGDTPYYYVDENYNRHYNPEYEAAYNELQEARKKAESVYPIIIIGSLFFELGLRLFADCAYREHIKRNIDIHNAGGTSVPSVALAIFFGEIISKLVLYGIMLLLILVLGLFGVVMVNF